MPATKPDSSQILFSPADPNAGVRTVEQELRNVQGNSTVRIALIGDSMTAQNAILTPSVTAILEQKLNSMGVRSTVFACNRDGHTYNKANTVGYIGTKTSIEACILANPDIVIFCLGINDALLAVESRTLAQIKADAATAFAAVRAGLPLAKIIYVSQMPYDNVNFTPFTCKNKGIPMFFHKLNSSGLLANYYTDEILESFIGNTTAGRLETWESFDTYIKTLPQVDYTFPMNVWRVARLGGTGNDGIHLNAGGTTLATGYLLKGLKTVLPTFASLIDNNFPYWEDPDFVFTTLLAPSGDGYTYTNDITTKNQNLLSGGQLRTTTWYLPIDATLDVTPNITDAGSAIFYWRIAGADPHSQVYVSIRDGVFTAIPGKFTDANGNASAFASGADTPGLIAGSNTLRYAVGNISLPATPVVFGPYQPPWAALTLINGWVGVSPGVTYEVPAYYIDKFKRLYMRGLITGGVSGTQFATLPPGARPFHTIFIGDFATHVQINPDGACFMVSAYVNNPISSVMFHVP